MAKKVKETMMVKEIKKEYLKAHLDYVESLIEEWTVELSMPLFLAPGKGIWGWQSAYRSSIDQDADINHILRKHLRSRALWSHHTIWERKMDRIWELIQQVRKLAKLTMKDSVNMSFRYHKDYLNTALWKGFEKACGKEPTLLYSPADDNVGVKYGAYRIEGSATDVVTRAAVEKSHTRLIDTIAVYRENSTKPKR